MSLAEWDARLILPARALELVGDLGVYASVEWADLEQFHAEGGGTLQASRLQVNLRCADCDQSCGLLGQGKPGRLDGTPDGFRTSLGDLLSGVLRHRVMAHDLPLNRGSDDGSGQQSGPGPESGA
jgi:hypothetical protein